MKNTKIISLVLALTLIAGVFAVLPVAAEEVVDGQREILAQTIVYKDTVSVAYAVDATVAEAEAGTVKVSYYYASDESKTLYPATLRSETYDVTNDNGTPDDTSDDTTINYPVFETAGFAPYNFTDVVFAVAYTTENAPENAQYQKYSVAQFLYAKLYKDDFISLENGDENYNNKVHYENMMAYGASAQVLYDADETPIDEYSYVYFANGDGTADGAASGFYAQGEIFSVSYTGDNAAIKGWAVNGGKSYVVGTSNAQVTAADSLMSFTALEKVPNIVLNPNNLVNTTIDVVDDPAEGGTKENVMHVTDPGTSALESTNWATVGMDVVDENSNVYVFESDIYIPTTYTAGPELISFTFMNSSGNPLSRLFIGASSANLNLKESNTSVSGNNTVSSVATTGTWFTLKIVLTNGDVPTTEVYINDIKVESEYLNGYNTANVGGVADYFQIGFMNQRAIDAYFDNVSYTQGVAAAE